MITNHEIFFRENQVLSSKYKCNIKNINLSKNQIIDMQETLIGGKLILIQESFLFFHENNAIFVGFLMGNFLIFKK